jgi:hypothetical protein
VVEDGSSVVVDLMLQSVQSVTECTAIDLAKVSVTACAHVGLYRSNTSQNEAWKMNAIVARSDATVHTLANTRFDLVNLATGAAKSGCQIRLLL